MTEIFEKFERIVRLSYKHNGAWSEPDGSSHPFDKRNIHSEIQQVSKDLFDDGHFIQATFEAFKCIEKKVQETSNLSRTGWELMMAAFDKDAPKIKLNGLASISDKDEQDGYKFIFGGTMRGIRNPRGHECNIKDTSEQCLDYLSLASLLLKRMQDSTVKTAKQPLLSGSFQKSRIEINECKKKNPQNHPH